MPWPAVVIRIESNDRNSCAVLRMSGLATKPSSCGWKVTVYVSVARESCPFLCAHGLLAEHRGLPYRKGLRFQRFSCGQTIRYGMDRNCEIIASIGWEGFMAFDPSIGKTTQFRKGQSGNAGGRPRSRLLSEALRNRLAQTVDDDPTD